MDKTKKKLIDILIFLYFVLFPFGHLITLRFSLFNQNVSLIPCDLIAVLFFVLSFLGRYKFAKVFKYWKNVLLVFAFSQLFFIFRYGLKEALIGLLHLLRFFSYSGMFIVIWDYVNKYPSYKRKIFRFLIAATFFVAVFAWVQYFILPDVRSFTIWGWDDHLFRIVGTYLDPTFTAIILVFGILSCYGLFLAKRKFRLLILLTFMLLALFFTYSRSGYLSLIFGFLALISIKKRLKISLILLPIFLLGIVFLPRPSSEGVHLQRTYSIFAKFVNYSQTIDIAGRSPLFGIGFNNICWARQIFLKEIFLDSHSCSGADSSILLVLATTGVVGLLIFASAVFRIIKSIPFDFYGTVFISILVSLFVHSLFSNSLFYPWVMGYITFLSAITIKE